MSLRAAEILKRFVRDAEVFRPIRFGISRGALLPINRKRNARMELGLIEPGLVKHFKRLANGTGYDIGAHLGYYTMAMLARGMRVVAFEPETAELLHEVLDRNGASVDVVEGYVGRDCAIDELVASGRLPMPHFVKIDIEGDEAVALRSMQAVVNEVHPGFIVEVHSIELEEECLALLRDWGYQPRIVSGHPVISRFWPETREGHNRWLVADAP